MQLAADVPGAELYRGKFEKVSRNCRMKIYRFIGGIPAVRPGQIGGSAVGRGGLPQAPSGEKALDPRRTAGDN